MPDADLLVRPAMATDVTTLLELFGELAEYEHLEHELKATEEQLREALFGERPAAEALTVSVEVPGGVGVPPPPVVPVVGIARLSPLLLSTPSAQSMTIKRANRG